MVKKKVLLLLMLACVVLWPVVSFGADANAVKDLFAQAQKFAQDDDYNGAETIYKQISAENPGTDYDFNAKILLTMHYIRRDKKILTDAAYESLINAFADHPDLPRKLHEEIGYTLRENRVVGRPAKARQIYQYMKQRWPQRGLSCQAGIIQCYMKEGDWDNTSTAIDELLSDYADSDLSTAIYDLAYQYRSHKKWEKSRDLYKYALSQWPQHNQAMKAMRYAIKADIKLGNNADAQIENLITAYADNPKIGSELTELADDYRGQNKWAQARELYEYCLKNWPQSEDAMRLELYVAMATIKLGEYEKADQAIDSLASTYADNPEIGSELTELADAYGSQNKWAKARELYEYCLTNWPQSEDAMRLTRYVARATIKLGEYEKADQAISDMISTYGSDPKIGSELTELADDYATDRNYEKAASLYTQVVDTWPAGEGAVPAQTRLARMYIEIGDYTKAAQAVEKLKNELSASPGIVEALEDVGDKYELSYSSREAYDLYKYLLQNWPTDNRAINIQMKAILSQIRLRDLDKANTELSNLLTDFAGNKELAPMVHEVVEEYRDAGYNEEGRTLFKYILENWTQDDATNLELQTGLALQSIKLNELDKAQTATNTLIADYNDHTNIGKALFQIAEEYYYASKYQHAIALWEDLYSKYGDRKYENKTELTFMLGHVHQAVDDHNSAIDWYMRTVEEQPKSRRCADACYQMGMIYYSFRNNNEQAEEWLGRSVELADKSESSGERSMFQLVMLYVLRMKDYGKGTEAGLRYMEKYPEKMGLCVVLHQLARCYEQAGDKEKAIEVLRQAYDSGRNDFIREETLARIAKLQEGGAK